MSLSAESVAFWGWDAGTAESAEFWGWYGENTYVAPATFISRRLPWPSLLSPIADNGAPSIWPSLLR